MSHSSPFCGGESAVDAERPTARPEQVGLYWYPMLHGQGTSSPRTRVVETEQVKNTLKARVRQNRHQRVLQDLLLKESLLAFTLAESVRSERELERVLTEKLPQNSRETRE